MMGFSPSGRFLIVGDRRPARLRVLDSVTGFRPAIEAEASAPPTSFVFECETTFLAGFNNGRFVKYTIDLGSKRLVKEWTNNTLRGPSPVNALALDEASQILALAVGPSVFIFVRAPETGETSRQGLVSRLTHSRRVSICSEYLESLRLRERYHRAFPSPHFFMLFSGGSASCRISQTASGVGCFPL